MLHLVLIIVQFLAYFFTVVLCNKLGRKKYTILTVSFYTIVIWFSYSRIAKSCEGKTWTLDNYYSNHKPFFKDRYLKFRTDYTTPYIYNDHLKACKIKEPTICWHFLLNGWMKPLTYFGDSCTSTKNLNYIDNEFYKDKITDPVNQVIAMPLIDRRPENKNNVCAINMMMS